ncbi:MAG TPA: hypothetical protein VM223_13890 [Planctomycetota bacterium]|nr:hypothetical protein [Planctomycetota bacterium]
MSVIDITQEPDALVKNIVSVAIDHRHPWVGDWSANFRRLAGFTENDVPGTNSTSGGQPITPQPATQRFATSFNVTRNFFYRLLGRVMPALVRYQVLSATRDEDDRDAAEIGAKYLRSRTSADSGDDFEPLVRTVGYVFAGGPAYYLVEPQYSEDGYPGGVRCSDVMPTDLYKFPGIIDANDSPAIVLDARMSQTQIQARYPKLASQIKSWGEIAGATWPEDVDFTIMSPCIDKGVYTVRRLLMRPNNLHPEGMEHISIVGLDGISEVRDTLDTYDKMYPVVTFADIPMGPFSEDRGRMTISSKMQRVLDIALSKSLDITLGGPQNIVGIPVTSSITPDDFTNRAWFFYDLIPGQELKIDQAPGMGNLSEVVDIAMRFMAEVHAQNPSSRGQSSGPRQSGRALEHLTQMDVAVDEPFLAMIRRAVARVGKRILGEAKRTLPDDYKFAAMGKYQRHQMASFKAANLREGFDVRVMPGGALPDDKGSKAQLVIKGLGNISLFSDAPEAIRAREIMGLNIDGEEMYEINQEEEQIIRTENDKIGKGTMPEVNPWAHNHVLHMLKHKQAQIRREALGPVDPEIKQTAQEHYEEHKAVIDGEMQKQAMMQQQMAQAAQSPA